MLLLFPTMHISMCSMLMCANSDSLLENKCLTPTPDLVNLRTVLHVFGGLQALPFQPLILQFK